MQPPCRIADQFTKAAFDLHMDIFELDMLGHTLLFIFALNGFQPAKDRLDIGGIKDALCAQHLCMCLAASDILPPKPLVDGDGGVYLAHDICWASAKPAAWYLWASQLDGRLICQQVSPGSGWKVQRGPYRDARCQLAGLPR